MPQQYNTRIQLKSDTEANWLLVENTFKPLQGEIIIYSPDGSHTYSRIKIGDGASYLNALDFIDAETINGKKVEIVKLTSYEDRPTPGSPDKLYIDTSKNIIYYYDATNGYTQLSNFDLTKTYASRVSGWNAGLMTTATLENNTLKIINGVAPNVNITNIEVVNGKSITEA